MGDLLNSAIEQYNLGISKKKWMSLEDYNTVLIFLEKSLKYENLSEGDATYARLLLSDVKTKMRALVTRV